MSKVWDLLEAPRADSPPPCPGALLHIKLVRINSLNPQGGDSSLLNGGASTSMGAAGGSSLDDLEDLTEEQVWEQIRRQDQQAQQRQAQAQQRQVEPSGSGEEKMALEEAKVDLAQVS